MKIEKWNTDDQLASKFSSYEKNFQFKASENLSLAIKNNNISNIFIKWFIKSK